MLGFLYKPLFSTFTCWSLHVYEMFYWCSVQGMVYMYRGQPGGLGLRQAAYHDIKPPTLKAGWSPCTKKVTEIVTIYVSLFFRGLRWDQRLGMFERTGTFFKWKEWCDVMMEASQCPIFIVCNGALEDNRRVDPRWSFFAETVLYLHSHLFKLVYSMLCKKNMAKELHVIEGICYIDKVLFAWWVWGPTLGSFVLECWWCRSQLMRRASTDGIRLRRAILLPWKYQQVQIATLGSTPIEAKKGLSFQQIKVQSLLLRGARAIKESFQQSVGVTSCKM